MKTLLALWILLSSAAGAVYGGPNDPDCSDIPESILISPDGGLACTVTVASCATGPLSGVVVEIEFSPQIDPWIAWTGAQEHPVVSAVTDAQGVATFHIQGSGCIAADNFNVASYVVQVRLDGLVYAEPSVVVSPDAVNNGGVLPTALEMPICQLGITAVTLSDATFHTQPIKLGYPAPCSKFTPPWDGPCGLEDAILLTPYVKSGVAATCQ